jgi:anti-sigma-K factor RskA
VNDRTSELDRLLALLTDRALFGLSVDEQSELELLAAGHPEVDSQSMDQVAAMVELSGLGAHGGDLPPDVRDKIRAAMPAAAAPPEQSAAVTPRERQTSWFSSMPAWTGWATAVALLVALLFSTKPVSPPPSPAVIAQASRTELIQSATDLVQVKWTATDPAAATDATGDVVWSNTAQEGYMRFTGLAANDPNKTQYQLWIFDAEQDEKYPIDGGVFDIPSGTDEVVVPISAKLSVAKPTMFAITIEKPGGVVVSSRERLPLLAKLDG